jgi:AraC family transcriptional regulator, alkane utilization regulator
MTGYRVPQSAFLSALALAPPTLVRAELGGAWGARGGCANFGAYLVSKGSAQLVVGARTLQLERGDAVLLLTGAAHVVRAHPDALLLDAQEVAARAVPTAAGYWYAPARAAARGGQTTLAALTFGTSGTMGGLARAVPDAVHLQSRQLDRAARSSLEALQAECDRGRQANPEVLLRLGEVVCLHALERGMELAAIPDALVLAVAAAALAAPEASWSVHELSRRAGLSRSRFCERFQDCFGEPPMRWLRRHRLTRAARWLEAGSCSVAEAAERLGYASEGAFRKAYRDALGRSARVAPQGRTACAVEVTEDRTLPGQAAGQRDVVSRARRIE